MLFLGLPLYVKAIQTKSDGVMQMEVDKVAEEKANMMVKIPNEWTTTEVTLAIGDTFRDDVSDGGQILGLVEIVPNKKWCPYSSCWVFLCISHLIHGNAIFDILESHAYQKYHMLGLLSTLKSEEFEKIDLLDLY